MNSSEDHTKQNELQDQHQATYPYPPPYPFPYLYEEEDEINLLDYIKVIWKYKWLIICIVVLTGVGSVFYSLRLPNIYRSEATIIPREQEKGGAASALSALGGFGGMAGSILGLGGSGSLDKFETVLKSRIFSKNIYIKHKFEMLPVLYPQTWDSEHKKWLPEVQRTPTEQDVVNRLSGMLSINMPRKQRTMTIAVEHTNPQFAKKMVDYYLTELSETLRQETLQDAAQNQTFLKKQLGQTSDVLLKEKIYALMAKEIEKETFARAQMPYSFQILDPPIVPDLNKKVKPKRRQICMLSVVVAGFMSIFLVFFIEYVKNAKSNEKSISSQEQQTESE